MKKTLSIALTSLSLASLVLFWPWPAQSQQRRWNTMMTCMACHVDPASGSIHGGFRGLKGLPKSDIDIVCLSCHDGSDPLIPEAAVHDLPPTGTSEFGTWTIHCLDCHSNHYDMLAGDGTGNYNLKMLGQLVLEASSTDDVARIRKPIISDPLGNNGETNNRRRYEDDSLAGWECSSGIYDDSACADDLTSTDDDDVRKLVFYTNIDTDATNWAQATAPYNGACNSCHTRAGNHRRDGTGTQNHKLPTVCTQCHTHPVGWTDRGQ